MIMFMFVGWCTIAANTHAREHYDVVRINQYKLT